jgi:hypothetical protein
MKNYCIISDSKGFAYALIRYAKTITTWYDGETITHYSTDSDKLGDKIYDLQQKGHKFTPITKAEFESALNEMLGYEECKVLSKKLTNVLMLG